MAVEFIETYGLMRDDAQVIVCPTNAGGVMGSGLAKYFREQIPGLFNAYRKHCKKHLKAELVPFVYPTEGRWVYCLHTKVVWWEDSSLDIVRLGLEKLIAWCKLHQITSVAMPALGCGRGALEFRDVKPIMEELLKDVEMEVHVYCP